MSIISKQIGWSQESNLLWEILKKINQLVGLSKPKYKIFSFLISQTGTDAPTLIPLENTLGVNPNSINKIYISSGLYVLGFDFEPDFDKTAVLISNYTKRYDSPDISGDTINVNAGWDNSDLWISTSYGSSGLSNNVLNNCYMEIRIYN